MTANVIGPGEIASVLLVREQPAGDINGVNLLFTASAAFSSCIVYLNGLAQSLPEDYDEISDTEIVMVEAPQPGDRLLLVYTEA